MLPQYLIVGMENLEKETPYILSCNSDDQS